MSARGPTSLIPVDTADVDASLPVFLYRSNPGDQFLENLLEHRVRSEPSRLEGFGVVEIAGGRWSILVEEQDGLVEGRVLLGIGPEDLHRLDAYQGVGEGLYRRFRVAVKPANGEVASPAYAYFPTERTLQSLGHF